MIHREDHDGVAVLRMEHGAVNAVDTELFDDLGQSLDEVEADDNVRAVVLTGTGASFSAGVNLFRVLQGGEEYLRELLPKLSASVRRFFTLPLPVVAAVNGHAIAGGAVLAVACDRRVMAEGKGRFGFTELLVGVPFPVAALEALRHLLPAHRVQDLVLTGRTVLPQEAHALGLVEELAAGEATLDRAIAAAAQLGRIPRDSFVLTKRHLRREALARMEQSYADEVDAQALEIWLRPEIHEVIRRFLEAAVGKK
jgi:enoyl-CoA hydratase